MPQAQGFDYAVIGIFVLFGVLFVAATVSVSNLLSPKSDPNPVQGEPYECGAPPVGPPWVQFRIGYYVYALLFLVFDIETVFLYPWAVSLGKTGLFFFFEMVVFLGILAVGLAYAWKEGALRWR